MEDRVRDQHSQHSPALPFVHACFDGKFRIAYLFLDRNGFGDAEMVDVLYTGGGVMATSHVPEEMLCGSRGELEESLACLAEIAAGVSYVLGRGWKGVDSAGSGAGEEGECVWGEGERRQGVLLQMIVDCFCGLLDLTR